LMTGSSPALALICLEVGGLAVGPNFPAPIFPAPIFPGPISVASICPASIVVVPYVSLRISFYDVEVVP
jgi:hypothetical protein